MSYVPFTIKMTTEEIVSKLKASFGSEFTATDIKAFCAMNDIAYATVTKRLKNFKTAKGKWNLEVTTAAVENIEKSFNSPSVLPQVEQNLVPEKDATKAQIKRAFNKSLKNKKMNKKILGEFIELVA